MLCYVIHYQHFHRLFVMQSMWKSIVYVSVNIASTIVLAAVVVVEMIISCFPKILNLIVFTFTIKSKKITQNLEKHEHLLALMNVHVLVKL